MMGGKMIGKVEGEKVLQVSISLLQSFYQVVLEGQKNEGRR